MKLHFVLLKDLLLPVIDHSITNQELWSIYSDSFKDCILEIGMQYKEAYTGSDADVFMAFSFYQWRGLI